VGLICASCFGSEDAKTCLATYGNLKVSATCVSYEQKLIDDCIVVEKEFLKKIFPEEIYETNAILAEFEEA
jgi:hypothetical protein